MGVFTEGNPFGIPDGLVCSLPIRCGSLSGAGDGGWSFDSDIKLTEEVSKHLAISVAVSGRCAYGERGLGGARMGCFELSRPWRQS